MNAKQAKKMRAAARQMAASMPPIEVVAGVPSCFTLTRHRVNVPGRDPETGLPKDYTRIAYQVSYKPDKSYRGAYLCLKRNTQRIPISLKDMHASSPLKPDSLLPIKDPALGS